MENAPIINKRRSLTLGNRLLHKRHSASPQSRACASASASAAQEPGCDVDACGSRASAVNVECTPPSKKMHSLDDSLDFSPHNNRLSPSFLFSQSLVTGSPEVGWRWNSESTTRGDRVNTTSDSGFDSEEFGLGAFKQRDRRKQVRVEAANEQRRKQLDNKQRRAQQLRDHELLKERCDKLHRQLDQHSGALVESPEAPLPAAEPPHAADAALADFLNDSDTDCFLLEATQQLESQSQLAGGHKSPVVTTPTSHSKCSKEKRASFYMKFLEDESESEDWLVALDEAMLQATQPKKPRISLQRYKSMPSNTAADTGVSNVAVTTSSSGSAVCSVVAGKAETPRIKRHASSHALSPASASGKSLWQLYK
ncbi:hypothetical protein KR222_003944 [Zaprionus bogoriensis]|nr:hypothetical protein KR222_003944 [Zaprionus bogoriensis]